MSFSNSFGKNGYFFQFEAKILHSNKTSHAHPIQKIPNYDQANFLSKYYY